MNNQPIGVFDSGIGGVTVLDELINLFPNEDFIYIGDTINLPYGTKTPEQLQNIVTNVVKKMLSFNVKAIVIACNTATANSFHLPQVTDIPIIGVVEPTALYAMKQSLTKEIAVLATNATIDSGIYQRYLQDAKGYFVKCSEFVDAIESSNINTVSSFELVRNKLSDLPDAIDTVILGCTHFGLYANEIKAVLPNAKQISCATPTALCLKKYLDDNNLASLTRKRGLVYLYVTGSPDEMKGKLDWFKKPYIGIDKI